MSITFQLFVKAVKQDCQTQFHRGLHQHYGCPHGLFVRLYLLCIILNNCLLLLIYYDALPIERRVQGCASY